MNKFLLYGHGGAYNHGAEAIIRTTVSMIRESYPEADIALVTHFKEQDLQFRLPVDRFYERDISALPGGDNNIIYAEALRAIDLDTICLSVGGDNYCYSNWHKWDVFLKRAREVGAKSILWSCSINPDSIDEEMAETLNMFDVITARERETYRALCEKLDTAKVKIVDTADVAFLLKAQPVDILQSGREYFAINLSPLIFRTSNDEVMLRKNIDNLIKYICSCSKMDIVLVPHVMMPTDNDYNILKSIIENSSFADRMRLLPDNLSVAEYKYVISKCRLGVFARTHAAIAAYSMNVPCVTIGYSVKAKGISEDFDMEQYMLDNKELTDENQLTIMVKKLIDNEGFVRDNIGKHLDVIREKAKKNISALLK